MGKFFATDQEISYCSRAIYYPTADGELRLARVQQFNSPRFREAGWEAREKKERTFVPSPEEIEDLEVGREASAQDVERATRRARKNAFDVIMCNHDLDTFATFTYSPERVEDKADYDECYKYLNTWLSNRVQRKGLKYVCVPERTKKGDIHFHAIMNSTALQLEKAFNPHTGAALTHKGKQLYNVADWKRGFTSAEYITRREAGDDEREAVSKYIFKYMGKQAGQKIGGRYVLIGGNVARPVIVYGDSAQEFLGDGEPRFQVHKEIDADGSAVVYDEWSFV